MGFNSGFKGLNFKSIVDTFFALKRFSPGQTTIMTSRLQTPVCVNESNFTICQYECEEAPGLFCSVASW
jgi:hypothetical protein